MKAVHLLALLVMNVLWAGSYSAFKALSAHLDAGEIVTLRFTLAAIVVMALWPRLKGESPRGIDLLKTAVMGILVFALGPRLQVLGVSLGKAGDSSVVVAVEPLVTAVAAALFLRERIPGQRWLGFFLGLFGVILLNGGWRLDFQWAALAANLIFISSFICESVYSVVGKPILARAQVMKVIGVSLFWGTLVNVALDGRSTLAKLPALPASAWWVVAYLVVICTLIGYTLWYVVIRETDVSLAALTILVQPVIGVIVAAGFLGEPLHWGQLWGAVTITLGLGVGLWANGRVLVPAKQLGD